MLPVGLAIGVELLGSKNRMREIFMYGFVGVRWGTGASAWKLLRRIGYEINASVIWRNFFFQVPYVEYSGYHLSLVFKKLIS